MNSVYDLEAYIDACSSREEFYATAESNLILKPGDPQPAIHVLIAAIKTGMMASPITWTGVGSRDIPNRTTSMLMIQISHLLNETGALLRSGRADGSDSVFELIDPIGATSPAYMYETKEIYIPWPNFQKTKYDRRYEFGEDPSITVFNDSTISDEVYRMANKLVDYIHPNPKALKNGPRLLHCRNIPQVVGANLEEPSDVLLCYAPWSNSDKTAVKGGTNTAFQLARLLDVPILNLYDPEAYHSLNGFIKGLT
jgi:hypothetical protein